MVHEAVDFNYLKGKLKGFSDKQLDAHFGLYAGYVKKLNEIEEKLKTADPANGNYSYNEFSELKRREAVAFNGTYLHQLYFENLSGEGEEPSAEVKKMLKSSFGDHAKWEANLKGSASSTPGWVVLTVNHRTNRLHNYIMYEHHIGLPVDQHVIMALDCWEHAFMIDYGTKKADYLAAFIKNINWDAVNKRYEECPAED